MLYLLWVLFLDSPNLKFSNVNEYNFVVIDNNKSWSDIPGLGNNTSRTPYSKSHCLRVNCP